MNGIARMAIVAALAASVAAVVVLKHRDTPVEPGAQATPPVEQAADSLPRLLDLGAEKCIPCKLMAPILEEMKKEYAGKFDVDFIDVHKSPAAGEQFNVDTIPTQIFYDAKGEERFRHIGFMSKEDILAKWAELGVSL